MAERSSASVLPPRPAGVVNAAKFVPASSATSLIVAVRVRPINKLEASKGHTRDIMRVMDRTMVVVLDPDESKDYLDQVAGRTKEKRYTFDIAFEPAATNEDVYNGTVKDLVVGVLYGVNTTVFAYGATGSGKTYTMVGSQKDPGLMILSLKKIFDEQKTLFPDEEFDVTCSYLEVYNEVIYDLLVKNSAQLELREDPEQGAVVAGLQHITVTSAADIMGLIDEGNLRRKTESTDANSVSSRSHAVLEIVIKRQTSKNHYKTSVLKAKLALVDLAGSERASETNNVGQKLRDGANINKSLLALANCINALGKGNSDKNYVPYRNSKLTRLLKDGLSGNSRTAMIATVSASSEQYAHSIGTLKYADRAKEIKTHIVQNVGSVESHIADYQRIIDNLQSEVQDLKVQLGSRSTAAALQRESSGMIPGIIHAASGDLEPTRGSALNPHLPRSSISSDIEVLGLIDSLVQEMNENIEERVNLQKALFEIEDANVFNRYELKQLEEFLEAGNGSVKDITEARNRRDEVLSAVKENDKERNSLKAEISENEGDRRMIQEKIDDLSKSYQNVAFLNLVSTFRLQAVQLQELKFQMAVRDQIIGEQRQVIANLWKILDKSGMGREKVLDIAKSEGIIMDGVLPFTDEVRNSPPGAGSKRAIESVPHSSPPGAKLSALPHVPSMNGMMSSNVPLQGTIMVAPGVVVSRGDAVATPNASLVGNRAKMRHKFWTEYQGHDGEDQYQGAMTDGEGRESSHQQGKRRYNRKQSARRSDGVSEEMMPSPRSHSGGRSKGPSFPPSHPPRALASNLSMGSGQTNSEGGGRKVSGRSQAEANGKAGGGKGTRTPSLPQQAMLAAAVAANGLKPRPPGTFKPSVGFSRVSAPPEPSSLPGSKRGSDTDGLGSDFGGVEKSSHSQGGMMRRPNPMVGMSNLSSSPQDPPGKALNNKTAPPRAPGQPPGKPPAGRAHRRSKTGLEVGVTLASAAAVAAGVEDLLPESGYEREKASVSAWAPVDSVGEEWGERMNRAALGAASSVSFGSVSHSAELTGPSGASNNVGLSDRLKALKGKLSRKSDDNSQAHNPVTVSASNSQVQHNFLPPIRSSNQEHADGQAILTLPSSAGSDRGSLNSRGVDVPRSSGGGLAGRRG